MGSKIRYEIEPYEDHFVVIKKWYNAWGYPCENKETEIVCHYATEEECQRWINCFIEESETISCNQAISGLIYRNHKAEKLSDEQADMIFEACRDYVASSAKGDRRKRIKSKARSDVKKADCLNRLVYIPSIGKVSWSPELAEMRNCFDC